MKCSLAAAAAATIGLLTAPGRSGAAPDDLRLAVTGRIDAEYPALDALYKHFHSHPELSFKEEQTAARLAAELRAAGVEVTEKVGGWGIVGILKNGSGPTVLVRTDMDGLPVQEETGLPYASTARANDSLGREVPVMHACGHDIHMTVLSGAARVLAAIRNRWSGTVVMIGQPAEERVVGARAMLADGLYRRFPKPDFAIALHDNAGLPAGTVATTGGFVTANVDTVNITVRGVGGHGAWPHKTKDPIVLAARIVLALQTIVSREVKPTDPAVVTVGSIHGGTKPNIISNEVKLELTLRSYSDRVRTQLVDAVRRICRGEAIAAGMPDDLMPEVTTLTDEGAPSTYNDPELTRRVRGALVGCLGNDRVGTEEPVMGAEDFSEFGRTAEKVPLCLFWLGAVAPEKIAESERTGAPLPSLHSSKFAPVPEPTIKTGVAAMTAAILELLPAK